MSPSTRIAAALTIVLFSSTKAGIAQAPAAGAIDTALARSYFLEAEAVVRRDAGALWGIPLRSPLIFGDPVTREVVAERGDTAGVLRRAGRVWTGTMPADRNVANTAQEWGGVQWITILWPPPAGDDAEARARRAELFAHEMWHGIQAELGIPMDDPTNAHLDEREGRLWLRLEARALRRALETRGEARRDALKDALHFRAARTARFEGSAALEGRLERHEGMASYTGLRLSGRDSAATAARARELLAVLDTSSHLGRSFAYGTGPAYGVILDSEMPGWRRRILDGAAPAALLGEALGVSDRMGDPVARAQRHCYRTIALEEQERERARDARRMELRARLVGGPVLRLPFQRMQMQIDPGNVEPLGEAGTVYRAIRISDLWGVLEAKGGSVLLAPDFSHAVVPRPDSVVGEHGSVVRGDGWVLTLAEGYRLREGPRAGDLTAAR